MKFPKINNSPQLDEFLPVTVIACSLILTLAIVLGAEFTKKDSVAVLPISNEKVALLRP
jgi:hypothetical protein